MEKAKEVALWYKSIFGEDYYLEIQNNGIKEQVLANQKLIQLSRELDIPLVATNDAHYLKEKMHITMRFYFVYKLETYDRWRQNEIWHRWVIC